MRHVPASLCCLLSLGVFGAFILDGTFRGAPLLAQPVLPAASDSSPMPADSDSEIYRYQDSNSTIRAYIASEQYSAAQAFLQAQPFADPFDQAEALGDVARWAGRAGQLETASAIVDQIVANRRAPALVELAQLHYYRGHPEIALNLLAAATQLPPDPSDAQNAWAAAELIAQAYAEFKQPAQARQVLDKAANAFLEGDTYFPVARIEGYLAIGAIDQATALLNSLGDDGLQYEAMIRIAKAYSNQGRQAEAIALLNQIPDRALMPLIEFADPKIKLLTQILATTLDNQPENEAFDLAIQIAKSFGKPADQVLSWVNIATAYPENQRPAAIEALDQALAIARTVERESVVINRHFSYSKSKADLLKAVAEGYRSLGQTDQSIAVIREALSALQAFRSDSPLALGSVREGEIDYGAIAKLAHDWQQTDFYETAISELEKQLTETESSSNPTETELSTTEPDTTEIPGSLSVADQILGLTRLTYEPNQPPSKRHQQYLTRLVNLSDFSEQSIAPTEQLALLTRLVPIYVEIDQPTAAEASVQQIIELTAQLPAEERDRTLTDLAFSVASIAPSDAEPASALVKAILLQLSSPQAQIEGLLWLINEAAANNKTAIALAYFEDFLSLSEQSLSASGRNNALANLNSSFVFRTADAPQFPPATLTQVAILERIPQYISDPNLRAAVAISTAPYLPLTESAPFYTALSETLAQLPNLYAKRELLWQALNHALSLEYFDHAEQLANALDDGYRQYALGWIETTRQQP